MMRLNCDTAEAGESHAHELHSWTSRTLGHRHRLQLFTYPSNGTGSDGHTHRYQGITAVANRGAVHFHRFFGNTGPAIPLTDGSHVHRIDGPVDGEPFVLQGGYYRTVKTVPYHRHSFHGLTGTPLGTAPPDW